MIAPDYSNSTLVFSTQASRLYVNGAKATLTLSSESADQEGDFIRSFDDFDLIFTLNNIVYSEEDLEGYLLIDKMAPALTLQAVDNALVGYLLGIKAQVKDEKGELLNESNEVVLEVML